MKFRALLFSLFLVCLSMCLFAQKQRINFRYISDKEGLSQSPVASVLQDKQGYVWVGNWSGLSRYDGTTFKNFRHTDTTTSSISHNRINKIYEDKRGSLWIGTGGGLNLYHKNTEKFTQIGLSTDKGGSNFITSIQEDSYGKLWVSSFKGIKFIRPAALKLETVAYWKKNGEQELSSGIAFSLFEDKHKTIWVGVKQGLKRFDPKDQHVLPLPEVLRLNKELSAAKILVIRQDSAGDLWFGTEDSGLFRYNPKENTCTRYYYQENNAGSLPSNGINDLLLREGKIWVATRKGLSIFDKQQNSFVTYRHDSADPTSINDDSVWSLFEDRSKNVWIGTYAGGINIYYPGNSNFSNIGERIGNSAGLNKPLANAIVEDQDGSLWIGTFGGGLNHIDRKSGTAKYYRVEDISNRKFSNEVKSILTGRNDNLWVGTLDGLCLFNKKSGAVRYIHLEIYNGKTGTKLINALAADEDGIWVGTNGGGVRFVSDAGTETRSLISNPSQKQGLGDNYINALLKEGDNIWIATQNGLNCYHKKTDTYTLYKRKNRVGLGNNNVLSLFMDAQRRLWIGTDGGGLSYLDQRTGKIFTMTKKDGLADDLVAAILADQKGRLWLSTHNGLSCITIGNNTFPLQKGDYKIQNYTTANGLPGNQFILNSSLKTRTGEILFGGANGVTSFYPDRIIRNIYKPQVLFTGLYLRNKEVPFGNDSPLGLPVNETSKITIPYADNNISLHFSALNFINPGQNSYAYKMTGLPKNEGWTPIGNQKEVSFINLAPGKYTFSVKAANNDGVWNDHARSITIEILPPVWRSWWAYLLYLIIVTVFSYKIIMFFRIRAKLETDLYNEHLHNERQEEFYQMKLNFFTNISHELRTPLTLILGPAENIYQRTLDDPQLNKQVLQLKSNADRLLRLIGELMDFRKAETGNVVLHLHQGNIVPFMEEIYLSFRALAESKNIQYELKLPEQEILLNADKDQLEKVFFNILSNAFKFTPDNGAVTIDVLPEPTGYLTVKITDTGKGIPRDHQQKIFSSFYQIEPNKALGGTGVGLAFSKSIVELHQGSITVQSEPSTETVAGGTTFTVMLPLKTSVKDNNVPAKQVSEEYANAMIIPPAVTLRESTKKYTLLLAEDNEELRNFIAESLNEYEIISCVDGADAYENAVTQIPDLIVSDVMMPVMDGLELCGRLKTDERTSHIPVILLTALAAQMHQVDGFKTGADIYLTKPFSTTILSLNVRNLLASREVMRAKFAKQILLQPQNITVSSPDEQFLKKLMKVVEDHMEDPDFGVVALAEQVGMSKTVLYKKITALTDLSPSDFLKSIRLKRAAFLLTEARLSVNETASLVGFNDRKYFSKEFKKLHGQSPSELIAAQKDAESQISPL
jgi:signal transduction histidine kinase/ligand-binding sensor domain-containing protein/AraC-like DNA-binding protein/ActR/RegA family two-component response regulator